MKTYEEATLMIAVDSERSPESLARVTEQSEKMAQLFKEIQHHPNTQSIFNTYATSLAEELETAKDEDEKRLMFYRHWLTSFATGVKIGMEMERQDLMFDEK